MTAQSVAGFVNLGRTTLKYILLPSAVMHLLWCGRRCVIGFGCVSNEEGPAENAGPSLVLFDFNLWRPQQVEKLRI
jgi:hypothetical protein